MIDGYWTLKFGQELNDAVTIAAETPLSAVPIEGLSPSFIQEFVTCIDMCKIPYIMLDIEGDLSIYIPFQITNGSSPFGRSVEYYTDIGNAVVSIRISYDDTAGKLCVALIMY